MQESNLPEKYTSSLLDILKERNITPYIITKKLGINPLHNGHRIKVKMAGKDNKGKESLMKFTELKKICEIISEVSRQEITPEQITYEPKWVVIK